jgi:hypothetical protein
VNNRELLKGTLRSGVHFRVMVDRAVTIAEMQGISRLIYQLAVKQLQNGAAGCIHCGALPLVIAAGRCEGCGNYQTETGKQ